MSRLIDAERLRKDILNLQDCYNGFSDTYDKACIIGVIDEQPTIDPVKRGRWVKLDMHPHLADHKCTACGESSYVPTCMGEPLYNFCPNCGARMDEVMKDE